MAKIRRIIPFGWWPANWGLTGDRLALARAEYYHTGEDLEREKARIQKPEGKERDLELIRIDEKYEKISAEESATRQWETKYADDLESQEALLAKVEMDLKFGKINNIQADKQIANILEEPWFQVVGGGYKTEGDTSQMTFELDWNDFFVEKLLANGFAGRTDDDIVDQWFTRTCREMMIEDFNAIDDIPMGGNAFARTRKERNSSGRSEYS